MENKNLKKNISFTQVKSKVNKFVRTVRPTPTSNMRKHMQGLELSNQKINNLSNSKLAQIPKFNQKYILYFVGAIAIVLLSAILFAWLVLDAFSPIDAINHFRTLEFENYFNTMLVLMCLTVSMNCIFLLFKISNKKFYLKSFLILNFLLISLILFIGLSTYVFRHPVLEKNYPEYDANLLDYTKPLEVVFNVPVKISELKPSIVPELKGEWKWEPYLGFESFTRKGKFYPSQTAFPEERFVVYIAGINKLADSRKHEYGFVFKAPTLPKIVSSIPAQSSTNMQRNGSITLQVDKFSEDLVDWSFNLEPELPLDVEFNSNNTLTIKPKTFFEQGKEYNLVATYKPKKVSLKTNETLQLGDSVKSFELRFYTATEPLVESFEPTGTNVFADNKIKIVFKEEMNKQSVEQNFSIEPNVAGTFEWLDSKTFSYVTSELTKGIDFTVKFKTGTESLSGGILEKDLVYQFRTIGKVWVGSVTPEGGSSGVSESTNIIITFDQEVDKQSAQDNFRISPFVAGNYGWDGNTLIYTFTSALAFQTTYEYKVLPGVKSVRGLDSADEFAVSFTTRSNMFVFNIPIYYQPRGFTCNIFTAKMILAWKGYSADYLGLINEVGYNDGRTGDNWSGNPYTEFVGTADGTWGYGAYYPVIQRIFSSRGIASEAHVGWNTAEIAKAVQGGHPVIIWRHNGLGSGANISWTASDGTYVPAFDGMHGSVITGYIGTPENPTSFYVNDPWLGQFWMNTSALDGSWSYSNRTALVVL